MATDPFDDVLNLEAGFYSQGYNQGLEDGAQAGRIEGRALGMEKGFEKFLESGRLASKAIVWANRLPPQQATAQQEEEEGTRAAASQPSEGKCTLPVLPQNARLRKNVNTLYALVEPETLSTANADEAVQDFDDRVKRAQGKVKIVERMVGGGAGAAKETAKEGTASLSRS